MNIFKSVFFLYIIVLCIFQIIECKKGNDKEIKSVESTVKVSIIIPLHNTAEFVERSIKSALNQTLKEIEVIIIDDHSTDNSLELVKQFESDKRLKIIALNKNVGIGAARNIGIGVAVGEFLGFIDSDDYADVRFFEYLYKYSKDQDLVSGIYVYSTKFLNKYSHHGKKKEMYHDSVYNSIWRREFINEHNIKFPSSREDVEFRRSFMKANPRKFIVPDKGIYNYYKRTVGSAMNFSEANIMKMENETVVNLEEENKLLKENKLPEKNILYCIYMGLIIVMVIGIIFIFYWYKNFERYNNGILNEELLKKDSYLIYDMNEDLV